MVRDRKSTRLNSSHTVIYTLSLHDALPIFSMGMSHCDTPASHFMVKEGLPGLGPVIGMPRQDGERSEEHTSELQSHRDLHSFPTRRSSDLFHGNVPLRHTSIPLHG